MSRPIISVDLDGTVHSYEKGWQDGAIYGTATPGFFEWLCAVSPHFSVAIYSTRSDTPEGVRAMRTWLDAQFAQWRAGDATRPDTMPPVAWPTTKPRAVVSIDDRALTFLGDWGKFYPDALRAFRPWTSNAPEQAMANEPVNPDHVLHTVTDEKGRKMAEKLFQHYVRDEAHSSRMPAYLIAVDRILGGMGGIPAPPEPQKGDAADPTDGDYADDEDIHAPPTPAGDQEKAADADATRVRDAVAAALARR